MKNRSFLSTRYCKIVRKYEQLFTNKLENVDKNKQIH